MNQKNHYAPPYRETPQQQYQNPTPQHQRWEQTHRNNTDDHHEQTRREDKFCIADRKCLTIFTLCFAIINFSFILPNLIYANQENPCVNTHVPGIAFTLGTWMKTDSYIRIFLTIFFMVLTVMTSVNQELADKLCKVGIALGVCYGLFAIAWLSVGNYMFWRQLNPSGACQGGVKDYMIAALTIPEVILYCLFCLAQITQK